MTNSFGKVFKFTSFGESHGEMIGCVVDGVPAGISLNTEDIQALLNERKPGGIYTSPRKEDDIISIESGVFEGTTTGAPIALIIKNKNQQSKDYEHLRSVFRPGHSDYTYFMKYGIWDHRGGGRASARETAMRVAASAIARKILPNNIKIMAAILQIGNLKAKEIDFDFASSNELSCPDKNSLEEWKNYLSSLKEQGDSTGAIIECVIKNVPIGLGSPVYGKLDAELAAAIMGINAVKAVEIGEGFAVCNSKGSENNDQIRIIDGKINFASNNSGGILGGISTGQDIILRFAVKPTSSTSKNQQTINSDLEEIDICVGGRHDPCIGIRAIMVAKAMIACVLADHYLLNKLSKF